MSDKMLALAKKILSEMKDFHRYNEPLKLNKKDIETMEWLISQAEKAQRYKGIINLFKTSFTNGDAEHRSVNGRSVQAMALLEELEGETQ